MAGRPEGLPPGTLPRALLERAGALTGWVRIRAMAEELGAAQRQRGRDAFLPAALG